MIKARPAHMALMTALVAFSLPSCGARQRAEAAREQAEFYRKVASGQYNTQRTPRSPEHQRAMAELRQLMAEMSGQELALNEATDLQESAQAFREAHGRWPKMTEVPAAAVASEDPWGNAYTLEIDGDSVRVRSAGVDGKPGTDDDITVPAKE